jgi:hypothetical protein
MRLCIGYNSWYVCHLASPYHISQILQWLRCSLRDGCGCVAVVWRWLGCTLVNSSRSECKTNLRELLNYYLIVNKSHKMPIPHIKQQIPVKQHRSYLNTIHNAGTHYRLTNVTENYNNILFSNLCDNFLYDLSSKLNKERDPSWCSLRWYMPLLIEIGSLCRSRQTLFSRLNNLSLDLTYLAGPAQLCIALHFACCCFLNTPRIKQFR